MNFRFEEAIQLLARTPASLEMFLSGLPEGWIHCNEGEGTWNAEEVIAHLIEAEISNWIPRIETLLREGESRPFPPFDRFAHLDTSADTTLEQKLAAFKEIRRSNLEKLKDLVNNDKDLDLRGTHPEFGSVTLRELLSTWVVHDLTHISQITRVMAERYRQDVGPWQQYLSILKVRK
ncbi:DinB family protein [Metaplanococcus flavidus]|uniref:DinB family protein n=1 Tax=Metaplanococcus flavidus TaxID=569883 RepID=A0ABW3LHE2_9BACL